MSKVEPHSSDKGKYQSTFDGYGHGEGNGKSKTAIYKHFKTLDPEIEKENEVIEDDSSPQWEDLDWLTPDDEEDIPHVALL